MPSKRASRAGAQEPTIEAHGWTLLAHPCFLDQIDRLMAVVAQERSRGRQSGDVSANEKVLAAIVDLAFDEIPRDPSRRDYRLGDTLGPSRKHWFRAKFGAGRFRLFFRYRSDVRIIVYAWVNDAQTLRTYGSRSDAYAVFNRMVDDRKVPDDWNELVAAARRAIGRLGPVKPRRK